MNKHKHLDLVSAVINRMAQNSFTVRGWCITLVTAVVAFGVEAGEQSLALAALVPLLLFWTIDVYYLRQERAFRRLYDVVRKRPDEEIDFDMTPIYDQLLWKVMFMPSITLWLYVGLASAVIIISITL